MYKNSRKRSNHIPFFSVFRRNEGSLLGINISRKKIEDRISPFFFIKDWFRGAQVNRGTKLEHTKACVIDPLVNPVSIKNEIFIRDCLRRDFIRALSSYIVNTVDVFHARREGKDWNRCFFRKSNLSFLFSRFFGNCLNRPSSRNVEFSFIG